MCSEGRRLDHLQMESKGYVGYRTGKLQVPKLFNHTKEEKWPSNKLQQQKQLQLQETQSESECKEYESFREQSTRKRERYSKSKTESKLIASSNLSPSKAANICPQLSQKWIGAQTHSQSDIYWSVIKEAVKLKEEIKKIGHCILMIKELMTKNIKCLAWRLKKTI